MAISIFLIWKDWWYLFQKAKVKGMDSLYDYAIRIKLRICQSYIGHYADILGRPYFPHGINGIYISGGAQVGKNCVIFQQVTIGSNTLNNTQRNGSPRIGNNCYIGAGATIIGNIRIGNNCRIGANVVVAQDIPDNSTVISQKPRIIYHDEPLDNRFYCMDKDENKVYFDDGKWIIDNPPPDVVVR